MKKQKKNKLQLTLTDTSANDFTLVIWQNWGISWNISYIHLGDELVQSCEEVEKILDLVLFLIERYSEQKSRVVDSGVCETVNNVESIL